MSYQIVERPYQPGLMCCLVSGTSELGRYVELGYIERADVIGCVYLSEKVAGRVAQAIGWVPVDEAETLRDQLATARAENAQLVKQLAEAGLNRERVELAGTIVSSFSTLIAAVEKWARNDARDETEAVVAAAEPAEVVKLAEVAGPEAA